MWFQTNKTAAGTVILFLKSFDFPKTCVFDSEWMAEFAEEKAGIKLYFLGDANSIANNSRLTPCLAKIFPEFVMH